MKKLVFFLASIITFTTCKKEDFDKTTYIGSFREYGSYITTINDTLRQVSYDSSSTNLFILTKKSSHYTLNRVSSTGDVIPIKDNFELNQNNEFRDTIWGGYLMPDYHIYIRIEKDSLFVDRVQHVGRPNFYVWEAKAEKLD
ncbi:hypothetical protein Oweho_1497 [Owenweeksia hongkongensis DSM 17368]|uniref:Uncharacterized protein n=1 Tax=Owenweeksia hongkongensis (strain DSM 17368 / CIP 108786 / JCM 12287 / NRRL B-23963 / UST20020801) TaxID=926562 RepID=G8R8Q8_OWEHD|nr:hypothetical protein [Owenweeksia hongkongensis]AEV32488.1 hypothetical protein Oweho_1497 [Owenweeksia hongkongensis DSM 17368]